MASSSIRETSPKSSSSTRRQRSRSPHETSQTSTAKPPLRPLIEQLPELIPYLQLHTEPSSKQSKPPSSSTFNQSPASQSTGTSQPDSERLSLLGLPGEIRNQIFRHVVVSDEPIELKYTDATEHGRLDNLDAPFEFAPATRFFYRLPDETFPPLTTVSRQVRREAQYLLIKENDFKVVNFSDSFDSGCQSPLRALFRMCEVSGLELDSITIETAKCAWIKKPTRLEPSRLEADVKVTKREGLLQVSVVLADRSACHLEQLAHMSEGSILHFLEGLWTRVCGSGIL